MSTPGSSVTLSADDLVLAYERTTVVHGVSVLLRARCGDRAGRSER